MSYTILNQTIIMLILIAIGVLCAKTKLISETSNKDLSKFVLQVVNPVVIFMSYQKPYKAELAKNLLPSTELSITEIAGRCGYANASKFSEVFKKNEGVLPKDWRK